MNSRQPDKAHDREDDATRHFVNAISVRVSLSSIHFDLAALGSANGSRDRIWRFSTTPSRFRSIHSSLGKAIDSYRSQFGEILADDQTGNPEDRRG